jgi:malate synthase
MQPLLSGDFTMTNIAHDISHKKLHVEASAPEDCAFLLSDEALAFVQELVNRFESDRASLMKDRVLRQEAFDKGEKPCFLAHTKNIREGDWKVAPIPRDLQNRRVEITGPAEPKMVINALNSGAKVFMADLEDSLAPTFTKIMQAQKALFDASRHQLTYESPQGKSYSLNSDLATMIVRPRGWHLPEQHVTYNGEPIAGAFLDFGLYLFHNAKERLNRGTGPYFYLPKLETHEEARLWADIFAFSEDYIGIAPGSIKATVLIEVITAAYEMHEILHVLRDYAVGLNCGRWDYIFSTIKKFSKHPEFMLPDRIAVTMGTPFLHAYSELLIQTCHKRGAFAMGGMSAFIPVKNDEEANNKAIAAVAADKEREVKMGHDGTWVAHPGLIPTARAAYDAHMKGDNQLDVLREDVAISEANLLELPKGDITEAGLRNNLNVSVQYVANWLSGNGCVPIFNLMEDAATAEIARSQCWQWLHHKAKLADGRDITESLIQSFMAEELDKISAADNETFTRLPFARARSLVLKLILQDTFVEFLTLPGYEELGTNA